jgi:hypothetical protein
MWTKNRGWLSCYQTPAKHLTKLCPVYGAFYAYQKVVFYYRSNRCRFVAVKVLTFISNRGALRPGLFFSMEVVVIPIAGS